MREILFRGKKKDRGEWVCGNLIKRQIWSSTFYVIRVRDDGFDLYDEHEVIPETIGEYTGLTDKNGKKIFEGDIVRWCEIKGTVVWNGHKFYIKSNLLWDFSDDDCIEVIGNIHDNPELLKGDKDVALSDCEIVPTDVAEVKHGEWIYHECVSSYDGTISGYSCSVCKTFIHEETFDNDTFTKKYCGYCGARMDGDTA